VLYGVAVAFLGPAVVVIDAVMKDKVEVGRIDDGSVLDLGATSLEWM
jgi:hypothetical protein